MSIVDNYNGACEMGLFQPSKCICCSRLETCWKPEEMS